MDQAALELDDGTSGTQPEDWEVDEPELPPPAASKEPAARLGSAALDKILLRQKTTISDRYLFGSGLGSGGYSRVYRGLDLTTGEEVAIKVGKHPLLDERDHAYQVYKAEKNAYKRAGYGYGEVQVPKVREFGLLKLAPKSCHAYCCMELLGPSVAELVRDYAKANIDAGIGGGLDVSMLVELGQGMLGVLRGLHAQGLVHRDVKPGNFCLRRDALAIHRDSICLIDLGFAAPSMQRGDKATDVFVGTPDYASDRALQSRRQGMADDLESLAYSLLDMALMHKGGLPWNLPEDLVEAEMMKEKDSWTCEVLQDMYCLRAERWSELQAKGRVPSFINLWLDHVQGLDPWAVPDYDWLSQLLDRLLVRKQQQRPNKAPVAVGKKPLSPVAVRRQPLKQQAPPRRAASPAAAAAALDEVLQAAAGAKRALQDQQVADGAGMIQLLPAAGKRQQAPEEYYDASMCLQGSACGSSQDDVNDWIGSAPAMLQLRGREE